MPGRKSNKNKYVTRKVRLPNRQDEEIFAIVIEIYGGDRMLIKCEDGVTRIGTIRGKIRKRMWTRLGDIVLCIPWSFETKVEGKREKAYIVWRYTQNQVNWLQNRGYLKDSLDIDNI